MDRIGQTVPKPLKDDVGIRSRLPAICVARQNNPK
jgi:hypothetical protein